MQLVFLRSSILLLMSVHQGAISPLKLLMI
jgi:hypothetical protein